MASKRTEQKEETRQRILDHAKRMVLEGGHEALTIAPLMSSLGLTHGGFYAHFESREALLDSVVQDICEGTLKFLESLEIDNAPVPTLEQFIDGYLSPAHLETNTDGCPLAYLSPAIPQLSQCSKDYYLSAQQGLQAGIMRNLRRAGVSSPKLLAQALLAELVGAFLIARALGSTSQGQEVVTGARKSLKQRLHSALRR